METFGILSGGWGGHFDMMPGTSLTILGVSRTSVIPCNCLWIAALCKQRWCFLSSSEAPCTSEDCRKVKTGFREKVLQNPCRYYTWDQWFNISISKSSKKLLDLDQEDHILAELRSMDQSVSLSQLLFIIARIKQWDRLMEVTLNGLFSLIALIQHCTEALPLSPVHNSHYISYLRNTGRKFGFPSVWYPHVTWHFLNSSRREEHHFQLGMHIHSFFPLFFVNLCFSAFMTRLYGYVAAF